MNILGIESSCDDTGVAIYSSTRGLLAHQIHRQIDIHAKWGGVVPELASRDHIQKCLPLIDACLHEAGLSKQDITGIAYTKGPGLIGSLMVGACVGKSLGWALGVPTIGVHHLESHLMAVMLEESQPEYPFIALLVSGGHTALFLINNFDDYELLGESQDDAAGEAFDKTAKLLGLPYPGGPHLATLAEQGDSNRFDFPRPMIKQGGLDFSFSGLKTYALNCFHEHGDDPQTKADIACAFQDAVVDTLIRKCVRAIKYTGLNRIVMVGGVSANQKLRVDLKRKMAELNGEIYYPCREFCTDNGAMVAYAGYLHFLHQHQDGERFEVKARLPLV